MSVTTEAPARVPEPAGGGDTRPMRIVAIGIGVVLAVAVVLRFVTQSDLWLDEALTVNVSRLPLGDISEWLRHDGAPPLYYWLLHGWTEVFGTSPLAVRSLSGVFSVATLPFAYLAGRRLGGRTVAWATVLLLAASPFAIRFATEARMYSLVMLLVVLGYLALMRALERPSLGRLACVAAVVAALLYTQYWSIYLLAVVGLGLLWQAWKGPDAESRHAARALIVAFVAGGIVFLPWVPNMLYQQEHTGTPWGEAILPNAVFTTMLDEFAGGTHIENFVTFWLSNLLFLVAVFGLWVATWRYELDLRTRPGVRMLAAAFVGTILVGALASFFADATFQPRYASIGYPLFVLVLAYGVGRIRDVPVQALVMVLIVALGLVGGVRNVRENRTQGGDIGRAIAADYQRGDVVVYCPDQLGPATSRLDDAPGLRQMVFPTGAPPKLVDWVDYTQRNSNADAGAFAQRVLDEAGPDHTVWLVSANDYSGGNEGKCEQIAAVLQSQRPASSVPVLPNDSIFEAMGLTRYAPA